MKDINYIQLQFTARCVCDFLCILQFRSNGAIRVQNSSAIRISYIQVLLHLVVYVVGKLLFTSDTMVRRVCKCTEINAIQ